MYFYKQTEPGLYTVGYEDSNGGMWHTDSDWNSKEKARIRVAELNGEHELDKHDIEEINDLLAKALNENSMRSVKLAHDKLTKFDVTRDLDNPLGETQPEEGSSDSE